MTVALTSPDGILALIRTVVCTLVREASVALQRLEDQTPRPEEWDHRTRTPPYQIP